MPAVPRRLGLGVGIDLPWGAAIGFVHDAQRGDIVSDGVVRFLAAEQETFAYCFVSWQPKDRSRLDARAYFDAYDSLFEQAPWIGCRALHQTAFNLGALESYDRGKVIDLTNGLVERYDLRWVNEDLGLWSIHGRPLPYPLPPYLTDAGLSACVRNTCDVQARLAAPLVLEFPGFSEGTSFYIGRAHAYDYFRRVVEDTGSAACLDTGHLLSYQWLLGRRAEALYSELDRLPTSHCFEIHLSGCEIKGDRFHDLHHGVLMDEQVALLERLLPLCPNVSAITYEDPKFDAEGRLPKRAMESLLCLKAVVASWTDR